MSNKYEIIPGQFPCHTCKEVVGSLRMYQTTKLLTWMCTSKHISSVSLDVKKKSKKDYDREIRD